MSKFSGQSYHPFDKTCPVHPRFNSSDVAGVAACADLDNADLSVRGQGPGNWALVSRTKTSRGSRMTMARVARAGYT